MGRPRQQRLPGPFGGPALPIRNLLILWDVDYNHALSAFDLVCPSDGSESRRSGEAYWMIPIPHPATSARFDPATLSPDEPDDLDDIQPLDDIADTKANADDA